VVGVLICLLVFTLEYRILGFYFVYVCRLVVPRFGLLCICNIFCCCIHYWSFASYFISIVSSIVPYECPALSICSAHPILSLWFLYLLCVICNVFFNFYLSVQHNIVPMLYILIYTRLHYHIYLLGYFFLVVFQLYCLLYMLFGY
jgi:hypothetical protein